ncbi:MAG: glycosyltransferase [Opitutus sp.]|nr:glycosyltransferase [Opitutus sp.]
MVSTHGYVAAEPPLGAADTGGQVVYVLELSKKLAQLGFEVDIWTRRFEEQPEFDIVSDRVRVIRVPCGGKNFVDKEYLVRHLDEWSERALRFIKKHGLKYQFFNSHYWDAGYATQRLSDALDVPHVHTPHSLGLWKKQLMERDFPEDAANFEKEIQLHPTHQRGDAPLPSQRPDHRDHSRPVRHDRERLRRSGRARHDGAAGLRR